MIIVRTILGRKHVLPLVRPLLGWRARAHGLAAPRTTFRFGRPSDERALDKAGKDCYVSSTSHFVVWFISRSQNLIKTMLSLSPLLRGCLSEVAVHSWKVSVQALEVAVSKFRGSDRFLNRHRHVVVPPPSMAWQDDDDVQVAAGRRCHCRPTPTTADRARARSSSSSLCSAPCITCARLEARLETRARRRTDTRFEAAGARLPTAPFIRPCSCSARYGVCRTVLVLVE